MCLNNFKRFERIRKSNPIIGYREWLLNIKNPIILKSLSRNFEWKNPVGRHLVKDKDSGLYSYNYYNNNNYYNYYNNNNYYNYYNNNYYYYNNYNNNNYYYIHGLIHQYGKVAIHKTGYRSEYAYIDTLFTIRKSDAKGDDKFLNWIDTFNSVIENLSKYYKCKTQHHQDFVEIK